MMMTLFAYGAAFLAGMLVGGVGMLLIVAFVVEGARWFKRRSNAEDDYGP